MKGRLFLVHWNAAEAAELAAPFEQAGGRWRAKPKTARGPESEFWPTRPPVNESSPAGWANWPDLMKRVQHK